MVEQGVLAEHVASYQAFLEERRYAPLTRHIYLCCIAHFAHWMANTGLSVRQIGETTINRFLEEHLPQCRCPAPVQRAHEDSRAALRLFLKALRRGGKIAPRDASDHISQELHRFDVFMTDVKGLAAGTRSLRLRLIGHFLRYQFGSKPVVAQQIRPADLRRFMFVRHQVLGASGLSTIAYSLRGYIQFRATLGDKVQHLGPPDQLLQFLQNL